MSNRQLADTVSLKRIAGLCVTFDRACLAWGMLETAEERMQL